MVYIYVITNFFGYNWQMHRNFNCISSIKANFIQCKLIYDYLASQIYVVIYRHEPAQKELCMILLFIRLLRLPDDSKFYVLSFKVLGI